MKVHSYFELATTLIGWHVANSIAEVLVKSGLVLLPLGILIWRNWSEPMRSQSMREAAAVSLRRMELDALIACVVIVLAFLPAVPVSRTDIRFEEPYNDTPTHAQAPNLPYGINSDSVLGIRIPVLWWLVYHASALFTDQVVSAIDKLDDPAILRASLLRIAQLTIDDEKLIAEIRRFRIDCFEPSLAKYQRAPNPPKVNNNFEAVDWLGSEIFLETEGYYRACSDVQRCGTGYGATLPVIGWPARPGQDAILHQPQCDAWWNDEQLGLRARLVENLIEQGPWLQSFIDRMEKKMQDPQVRANNPYLVRHMVDRILRRMLNQVPRNMVVRADREPGIFIFNPGAPSFDWVQQLIASFGALMLSALMHIMMELILIGLPMLQALMLMLLYMALPLAVPYAVLQPGIIVRAVVLLFSLRFLSALWAVAEFLDEKLLRTMYPDWLAFEFGGSGTVADVVLGLITLTAYLTLPVAWFLLMGAISSRTSMALAGSWGYLNSSLNQTASGSSSALRLPLRGRRG